MAEGWIRPNWRAPELEPALQRLADEEAAARSAWDHAMARCASHAELEPLRVAWSAACDRLADAISERNQRAREGRG